MIKNLICIGSMLLNSLAVQAATCNDLSATTIHQDIINGKYTVNDCIDQLFNLIKRYDSKPLHAGYNTFIAYHYPKMRENEQGLLAGVPIAAKDNIDIKGFNTTAGTKALKNNDALHDAAIVKALKAQGGIFIGKTNMHELAAGVTSSNDIYGPVRNPYNKTMFAGGSSGGSAAAVALGFVPVALGTDTAGSIRIPAALCGVVGFRPSLQRYPLEGVVPAVPTFDTVGTLAKNVSDIMLLDTVLTHTHYDHRISLKGLRIGVPRAYFYENLDPETKKLTENLLHKLTASGAILVERNIPDLKNILRQERDPIADFEFPHAMTQYLKIRQLPISFTQLINQIQSKDLKTMFLALLKHPISTKQYQTAIRVRKNQLFKAYKNYFDKNHVAFILFPTTPLPASKISSDTVQLNGQQVSIFIYARNTTPAANAGLPAVSIPIALTKSGLPVGIELDAKPNEDKSLLLIAREIETLVGFIPKPVPQDA